MPTVLRIGPYRIGFWSRENDEPPHVHVYRDKNVAKLWLRPVVSVAGSRGFAAHELTLIRGLVEEHRDRLLEAWNDHFH